MTMFLLDVLNRKMKQKTNNLWFISLVASPIAPSIAQGKMEKQCLKRGQLYDNPPTTV
jgi:hypothetical protein